MSIKLTAADCSTPHEDILGRHAQHHSSEQSIAQQQSSEHNHKVISKARHRNKPTGHRLHGTGYIKAEHKKILQHKNKHN